MLQGRNNFSNEHNINTFRIVQEFICQSVPLKNVPKDKQNLHGSIHTFLQKKKKKNNGAKFASKSEILFID